MERCRSQQPDSGAFPPRYHQSPWRSRIAQSTLTAVFKLSKSLPSTKALNCWLMNGVITESLSAHFFRQHDGSLPLMPQTLLGLKRYGLVSRTAKPTIPPRVDYAITILGRSLFDPIGAMAKWVVDKHPQIIKARRAFDAAR